VTLDANAQKSTFLREMIGRGHVYQITDEKGLDEYATGVPTGYIGFDCTAKSLHVGSLVQIMNLRRLQQAGGKPIVLMGGGTTKIGDPTDKEKSRPILTTEEIASNMAGIKKNFEPFLTFGSGPTDAIMIDNAEWLDQIKWIEFLRDYGKHFTINKMIAQETVRRRLDNEEPYTFLEFNYMLLQSYDFLELARRYDCRIQMGGSDQWGNIVNGIDLTRRIIDKQVFGVTTPLITTASGGKMGKTAEGAVWLNPRCARLTTTGSSGGTRKMRTLPASCGCSPTCQLPRSQSTKRRRARRSTTRRSALPMWRRRCFTARKKRRRLRTRRRPCSRAAVLPRVCRHSKLSVRCWLPDIRFWMRWSLASWRPPRAKRSGLLGKTPSG
jgi:hypothetical protein